MIAILEVDATEGNLKRALIASAAVKIAPIRMRENPAILFAMERSA